MDDTPPIPESEEDQPKSSYSDIASILTGPVFYERMPLLDVVFDRFVRLLSTTLRNFTSDSIDVVLESTKSMRLDDYLKDLPLPAMFAIFRAREWDNQGFIVIDGKLVYSMVDVLTGGKRAKQISPEGRSFTTLERRLIERLIRIFLEDLSKAFTPLTTVHFDFERLEINSRFATIARGENGVMTSQFKLEMEDRGGTIDIALPYATIEPVRELLLQNFMGERFGRDTIWEHHLADELFITDMVLDVVFGTETISLLDVFSWKKGSQIFLKCDPNAPVYMVCGKQKLFEGKIGQKSGNVAVKIEKVLLNHTNEEHDQMDS
jgi:flagellar motor switch protein FliM